MKVQANTVKKGMTIDGREVATRRNGVGSGKGWTYLTYTDGQPARTRIRGCEWIEVGS